MATLGRNIDFPIKNADGTSFEGIILHKATVDSVVMSLGDKITGEAYYRDNSLNVTMQEYIEYNNVRYYLVNPPTIIREGMVTDNSELKGTTKYSFEFYHPMYMLANFPFTDIAVTNDEKKYLSQNKKFSWIGKPQDYINKINKNLQGTQWIVAKSSRFPIEKDDVLSGVLSFDNNTIADALKTGYETWDIPYVISQINVGETYYSEGKRFLVEYGLPSNEIYASAEDEQLDQPFIFQYGQGVGLKNNSRTPKNNKIVTRISGYGSENNIPYGYPQIRWYGDPDATQTPDGYPIYKGILGGAWVKLIKHPFTRTVLMPSIYRQTLFNKISPYLSDGTANPDYNPDTEIKDYYDAIPTVEYPYIHEINPNAPSYEIHGFDDIKPELGDAEILDAKPVNSDLTPAEDWDDTMDDDGNYLQSYFMITLPQLSFDLYACAAITEEMQINMRGGACIGCTFPIQIDWEDYKANFWDSDGNFVPDGAQRNLDKYPKSNLGSISIIVQKEYATFGTIMPNIYQHPVEGDAFVILGISLPESYVTLAEERLDDAMKSYMLENNVYYFEYPLKFDEHFFATHTYILEQVRPNSIIRFLYNDEELALFVKQITIKYGVAPLPQYDITLTDDIEVVLNQIGQVEEDVEHLSSLIAIMRENYTRNVWVELAKKLSKSVADTAQGVITFAKGLLFGNGQHGITEDGDANLNNIKMTSTQSEGYTGTDIISDKGFKVWEDGEGKSHLMIDYFTARIKAFFASLEIRKIEHTAGNRIESPAGNTLALVKKYDSSGHVIPDEWHARRYGFGLSWGKKLVFAVGQFFGVWKQGTGTVAFYRCYWASDDKEEKKAVENNWQLGDQAFCETFNLRNINGYVSNKRYWRLVVGKGFETISGKEYAYIDLTNVAENVVVDSHICKHGYETGSDAPEVGDDVACFGNQIVPDKRGGAIQYVTYDPNIDSSNGEGVPCVKMFSGIGGDADHPFELNRYIIQKQSPKGVSVRADQFTIYSASGTGFSGNSSPLICDRGSYSSTSTYAYGDLVQYHGSSWVCIASSPISNQAPVDGSSYWKIYARKGMNAPQVSLDSVNAVVSANSEGKITSISAATGLPTIIELYVDGNRIPVSAWDLTNSTIRWYNNTLPLDGSIGVVGFGILVNRIRPDDNDVKISWKYEPEIVQEHGGAAIVTHPVINPTDISIHIVFTYDGETYTADVSAPMIVQRAGADGADGESVQARYSADNSSWHTDLRQTDLYVSYSYDGGTTWTGGIRFVGKSIEFSAGIRHYEEWDDLNDFISDTIDPPIGYYLCDEDDSNSPEATLWYYNGTQLSSVSYQDELNYIAMDADTGEEGHLWNSDGTLDHWTDLGIIQGADGVDGISITLDPAQAIFQQSEDALDTFSNLPFVATVHVWKGTTLLNANSYTVSLPNNTGDQDGHCLFHNPAVTGNQIQIDGINYVTQQDNTRVYYDSGKVKIKVTYNNIDTYLYLNWAANLLGSWKLSVRNDTMTMVSTQECAVYDANGNIVHIPFSSIFGQSAQNIFATVAGLAGITGIDLSDGSILLRGNKVTFANSSGTVSGKISIDPTTGTLHAVDGDFQGTLNAKSYLTRYADLETYCYDEEGGDPDDRFFIPAFHTTMYDVNDNPLNIEGFWCFRVGAQGMEVWLPTKLPESDPNEPDDPNHRFDDIDLTGQRIVLYNPKVSYRAASDATIVKSGVIGDGGMIERVDVIRGVGLQVSSTDPVLVNYYDPVYEIQFCDGIIELQCLPSSVAGEYEWCVVNLGTNVYKLYGNNA